MIRSLTLHSFVLGAALALAACGGKTSDAAATTPNPCAATPNPCASAPDPGAVAAAGDPLAAASAEAIAKGASIYEDSCSTCHGDAGEGQGKSPALKGDGAMSRFGSSAELIKYTKESMPKDDPGSLSEADVIAVLAWLKKG